MCIVECIAGDPYLLGQVIPVPRFNVGGFSQRGRLRRQSLPLLFNAGLGGLPHLTEQFMDREGVAGHAILKRVVRIVFVAEQTRLLLAQHQYFASQRPVIACRIFSTSGPGTPSRFPQITAGGPGKERLHQRTRERNHVALHAALPGGAAGRLSQKLR